VRLLRIDGASGIEIAVLLLRGGDLVNQAVNISLEFIASSGPTILRAACVT